MVLKFSADTFRSMEAEAAAAWDREVAGELLALHPADFAALDAGADAVSAFVRTVRDYAVAYRVTGRRETYRLVVCALALGAHFPHDPRFGLLIERTLARLDVPQDRRAVLFCDGVEAWAGATDDGTGLAARGAGLTARVRRRGGALPSASIDRAAERAAVADALYGFVPQSPTIAPPERRAAFLDGVLAQADGYGLREPWRRLAYVGGALLHGAYWFDDPLMAGLRGAVTTAVDAGAMCDRLDAIYAGFA